jgi:hypothetical protein
MPVEKEKSHITIAPMETSRARMMEPTCVVAVPVALPVPVPDPEAGPPFQPDELPVPVEPPLVPVAVGAGPGPVLGGPIVCTKV